MPSATRQRVLAFTSPDLRDLLFWERDTLSRADYTDLVNDGDRAYGTPHPNTDKFPNHKLCYWEGDPDFDFGRDGQDSLRVKKYYVADRADQDKYNFEFTAANIGGQKFDAVQRTYVTPRSDFDEVTPAMGSLMSRDPSEKFSADYVLSSRTQKRIGNREIDALYVAEVRVYVRKVTISRYVYDDATGGSLRTRNKLFYRGESYNNPKEPSAEVIESAVSNPSFWGLHSNGVKYEYSQLSEDWWAITEQDVIPQTNTSGSYGKIIRLYDTWQNFSWPSVIGASSLKFKSIERKNGSSTVSVEVRPEKDPYSGPTRFQITESWSPFAVTLADPVVFDTKSGKYSGAQFNVGFSNSLLNGDINLIDTIGTEDPVFEPGVYGGTPWETATNTMTWPTGPALMGISQRPFRGGFLITEQKAYPPY